MRYSLLIVFIASISISYGQKGKKVQFVGGARSLMSSSTFSSDPSDSVTSAKSNGGYALIDLGIKINPNKDTEILGMFRIRNDFGGFWGSGVTFDVRQLYVRGVAAKVLRYHIGNIDYKMTPYTFYNHDADILTASSGTMAIKEDIFNYESFFKDNTWRQQGASINFALQFPKIVKEIEFNGFISRLNPTDFTNVMERLYGGGNMVIKQSKHVMLGLNHVSIFDIDGTAIDSNVYTNNVSTLSYDFTFGNDKFKYGVDGESGISSSELSLEPEDRLTDYFIHTRAYFNLKKRNLGFDLGYMNNGADFRSFGAQSKRIDYDQQNNFFKRYTNDQIVRPLSMYDLYNDPTLYSAGITDRVMQYNPAVNNALPYGIATFNRKGAYVGVSYSDSLKIVEASAKYYHLGEVRGQGTTELKSFSYLKSDVKFSISKLAKWKNNFSLHAGFAFQNTTRSGEFTFEEVGLTSATLNVGIELEVIKKLSLLGNFFMLQSSGVDQLPVRNTNGEIVNYEEFTIDGMESNIAGGLKFAFSEKVYLAAIYELNSNNFVIDNPYKYNQMSIYYVMKF
ncbi:MAG: hypothetical protein ACI865_003109 [Flavobacteriaceae bacterium]|jgi:hypothetical protein